MKTISIILAALTWIFSAFCAYLMFYADAGPDGLGTFFTIIIIGVLSLICGIIFSIQIWFLKEISKILKLVYTTIVLLPLIFLLWKTFYVPQVTDFEVDTIEVEE